MSLKLNKSIVLYMVSILAVVLSACASAAPSPTATTAPASGTSSLPSTGSTVQVANNTTLGSILTDSKGMTLYLWKKDTTPGASQCNGQCATIWPPFTVPQGTTPTAGTGVTGTLGTITRSDNTIQVTINGLPLYYYSKDTTPGDAKGQGIGSVWYVVGADGNAITTGGAATPGVSATSVISTTQPLSATATP